MRRGAAALGLLARCAASAAPCGVPGLPGAATAITSDLAAAQGAMIAVRCASGASAGSEQGPGDTSDFGFSEVPRSQKTGLVAQVFSSVASSYDIMNDLMSGGLHRCWKDQLVETLGPFPGMQHLDVAGGTGDVAFRVLRAIRAVEAATPASTAPLGSSRPQRGRVVLCDINQDMLTEGQKKAAAAPDLAGEVPEGLQFELGNAEQLSQFEDGAFDSYTIAFGIRNVTDRAAALREAYRVLRPGGRFLCLEFSHVSQPLLRSAYDTYSFNVIPQLGGLVAGDTASYQYLVESIRQFPDQDTWAGMIEAAGFAAVGYENILGGVVALHSGFKLADTEQRAMLLSDKDPHLPMRQPQTAIQRVPSMKACDPTAA